METDSNDSQKNAVFGIVVSNTGKKGACTGCRGVHPLPHTAPSTDSFDPLLYFPFGSSMICGAVIFSAPVSLAMSRLSVAQVSSPHLT
jgi:hypothetical protein